MYSVRGPMYYFPMTHLESCQEKAQDSRQLQKGNLKPKLEKKSKQEIKTHKKCSLLLYIFHQGNT